MMARIVGRVDFAGQPNVYLAYPVIGNASVGKALMDQQTFQTNDTCFGGHPTRIHHADAAHIYPKTNDHQICVVRLPCAAPNPADVVPGAIGDLRLVPERVRCWIGAVTGLTRARMVRIVAADDVDLEGLSAACLGHGHRAFRKPTGSAVDLVLRSLPGGRIVEFDERD